MLLICLSQVLLRHPLTCYRCDFPFFGPHIYFINSVTRWSNRKFVGTSSPDYTASGGWEYEKNKNKAQKYIVQPEQSGICSSCTVTAAERRNWGISQKSLGATGEGRREPHKWQIVRLICNVYINAQGSSLWGPIIWRLFTKKPKSIHKYFTTSVVGNKMQLTGNCSQRYRRLGMKI